MVAAILLYVGAVVITLWGVAHIIPTRSVVKGFEPLSGDNRRILTMEWIAEGLTLCFIGVLVLSLAALAGPQDPVGIVVYRLCALMLLAMAMLSSLTGARTSVVPMRICPYVKGSVAILFFLGTLV